MRRLSSALLIAGVAACTAGNPQTYAGPLQPLSGTCDSPLRAELSLRGKSALFTPSSGTLVLRGQRTNNDVAAQESLITPDHKPYTISFNGHVAANSIDGTYATPRCRYQVHLSPTQD